MNWFSAHFQQRYPYLLFERVQGLTEASQLRS